MFNRVHHKVINPAKKLGKLLKIEADMPLRTKIQDVLFKLEQIEALNTQASALMALMVAYIKHLEKNKADALKANSHVYKEFQTRLKGNADKVTSRFCAEVSDAESDTDEKPEDRAKLKLVYAKLSGDAQSLDKFCGYDTDTDSDDDEDMEIGVKNGEIVITKKDSKDVIAKKEAKDSKTCEKRKKIADNVAVICEKERIVDKLYDLLNEINKLSNLNKIGCRKLSFILEQLKHYTDEKAKLSKSKSVADEKSDDKDEKRIYVNLLEWYAELLKVVNDILDNKENGLFVKFRALTDFYNGTSSNKQKIPDFLSQARAQGWGWGPTKGSTLAGKVTEFINSAEELFYRAGAHGVTHSAENKPKSGGMLSLKF